MSSIEYSVQTLTEEQAEQVAHAYIKGDKDPPRMARILGVSQFDLNVIMHPLTRKHIVRLQQITEAEHPLSEHMKSLKKIRDAAFDDDNFKVALAAETQLGKAAGHYDPKLPGDEDHGKAPDPTKLTTDELRRRIAGLVGAVVPVESAQPHALPEPNSREDMDDDTV